MTRPGLRHLAHPVRTARSVRRRVAARLIRRTHARDLQQIARSERERCWCGGELREFPWHSGYGVCIDCGCYVNRRPPTQESLQRLYGFDLYWHDRVRSKGQAGIEQRLVRDRTDGRLDYWLGLVERFAPRAERVVEVGCGHGVLLQELQRRGRRCVGVEPDPRTADWTSHAAGVEVRSGLFPDVEVPPSDLFMAFDVIEHSLDPVAFLQGAARVLRPGGVAILQTPVDRYGTKPPFAERFKDAFDDVEHLFLFTDEAIRRLASRAGLEVVDLSERLMLHHEICVLAAPPSPPPGG